VARAVETPLREKLTPEEAAERHRLRQRAKEKAKREKKRAAKAASLAGTNFKKTSPEYRRQMFGVVPEKSKSELRAEIAQAVRNTQAMQGASA
jgi:hypothetical protein